MILITGGTGFIGSHTVAALGRTGVRLRQLVHRRPAAIDDCTGGLELVQGDLTDPSSLVGLCTGVDTVVHLASEAGNDEQICTLVNVGGTRRLIDAARKAGVRRMIYLSTAAVYGDGGHTGINEDEISPAPVSPASRTRLSAERAVLAAGGVALRPMFVYGPGDVWFIPTLARILRRLPVSIDGGQARLSLVAVDDLAAAIAALALGDWAPGGHGVLHAAHPEPVTVAELVATLSVRLGVPTPACDVPFAQARELLDGDPRLVRQLELIATDHFYAGLRLWELTGVRPAGFAQRFAGYADWYRAALNGGRS